MIQVSEKWTWLRVVPNALPKCHLNRKLLKSSSFSNNCRNLLYHATWKNNSALSSKRSSKLTNPTTSLLLRMLRLNRMIDSLQALTPSTRSRISIRSLKTIQISIYLRTGVRSNKCRRKARCEAPKKKHEVYQWQSKVIVIRHQRRIKSVRILLKCWLTSPPEATSLTCQN